MLIGAMSSEAVCELPRRLAFCIRYLYADNILLLPKLRLCSSRKLSTKDLHSLELGALKIWSLAPSAPRTTNCAQ